MLRMAMAMVGIAIADLLYGLLLARAHAYSLHSLKP